MRRSKKMPRWLVSPKVRENRLRRIAARRGFRLFRSRRRDALSLGFGLYALENMETGRVDFGQSSLGHPTATLEEIESYLSRPRP